MWNAIILYLRKKNLPLFFVKNDIFVVREVTLKKIYHRWPKFRKWKDPINYNYKKLKDKIVDEGYEPEKHGYMQLTRDNVILNGHHRREVLEEIYGGDYKFMAKKHLLPYPLYLLMYILIACVLIPTFLIKYLYSVIKKIIGAPSIIKNKIKKNR